MRRRAIAHTGTRIAPHTTVVPINTEQDMAAEFAAVILPFSNGELAKSAKRGKEAVKKWKAGRSLPSFWSIANLARENPTVRAWILSRINVNPDFNSPQFLTMAVAGVYQMAHQDDEAGRAVRAMLAKMGKGNG